MIRGWGAGISWYWFPISPYVHRLWRHELVDIGRRYAVLLTLATVRPPAFTKPISDTDAFIEELAGTRCTRRVSGARESCCPKPAVSDLSLEEGASEEGSITRHGEMMNKRDDGMLEKNVKESR